MVPHDGYLFHREQKEGLPLKGWCAADQTLNQLVELERDL